MGEVMSARSAAAVLLGLWVAGCSAAKDEPNGGSSEGMAGMGSGAGAGAPSGMGGANSVSGAGGGAVGEAGAAGGGEAGAAGAGEAGAAGAGEAGAAGAGEAGAAGGAAGSAGTPAEPREELDPSVDWDALTLVYPTMYSGYDGVHTFQVPVYVDGATVELADWSAIPSSAVTFDPDPENGGVLVTVLEPVEEITIAARSGPIGGTAPLYVTVGTPEQWDIGDARYNNNVEFNLPDFTLETFTAMLLDPTWMPPPTPTDLACNNCHTFGAKYFEVQHTPTQAARFSDEELKVIMTTGTKPDGVGFRTLPPMLGAMTAQEMYADFHRWEASDEELTGMILYLRSRTPVGQGDILLPGGTYVPPGSGPPML